LSAPANNAVFAAPASITLSASATDAVGRIVKVDFYQGASLIGTATSAPFSFTWTSVAAGQYSLSAVATNDAGQSTTSAAVAIAVDAAPTVSLDAPASGALFTAPATITLAASAADAVGRVTKVDFYQGATLIGSASASPYTFAWTNVAAGSYSLTAVATNDAGQSATSAATAITVRSAVAQLYFSIRSSEHAAADRRSESTDGMAVGPAGALRGQRAR
jgi:chitinase